MCIYFYEDIDIHNGIPKPDVINYVKLKTKDLHILDIQVGKTLTPTDLTSLDMESMEGASFKEMKMAYPKLCLKIIVK